MNQIIKNITIYDTRLKEIFLTKKNYFFLISSLFISTIFLKFYNVEFQGFVDSDVFAHHEFLVNYFNENTLEGTKGSMWGRPSRTFIQFFIGNIFGFTDYVYNLTAIAFSILLIFLIFIFCKKNFNNLTSYYVLLFCSFSFSFFYWSRIAKFIIPSIIILILILFVAFKIIKNYKNKTKIDLYKLGFLLSLSVTFHPNTLPTILSIGSFFVLKEIYIYSKSKFFDFKSLSYIFFGFISVIFFYEIIFIFFKYSSNWFIFENVSWIGEIFNHSSMIDKSRGGVLYYGKILYQEGLFFTLLILIGLLSLIQNFFKLKEIHYFLFYILVLTLIIYLITGVNPRLRNVFQLFIIIIILSSYGLSCNNLKFKFIVINILFIFVIINFFVSHLSYLNNFKNLEIVNKKFGGIENISMIKTEKTTYQFEKYYHDKFYSNWKEVWSGYFCDNVSFFLIPPGVNFKKFEIKDLSIKQYYLPNDEKGKTNFKLIDLKKNIHLFDDLFDAKLIYESSDIEKFEPTDVIFDNQVFFLILEGNIKTQKKIRNKIKLNFFYKNELIHSEQLFLQKKIKYKKVKKKKYEGNYIKKSFLIEKKNINELKLSFSEEIDGLEDFKAKIVAINFKKSINLTNCKKI